MHTRANFLRKAGFGVNYKCLGNFSLLLKNFCVGASKVRLEKYLSESLTFKMLDYVLETPTLIVCV